ncbi:methyltransferase family protein [Antarcticimicrobium luteum]|uniref:Heavy metal resistance protein CzcN n=1 Tax=Antarcticimicrobium luteum TaxID=2547397 RepID=A0A4R5VC34_9RHOB|nr:PEMT/PEM2 methyltransferase family protein [Antarcticimicrobium luteum]TDK49661.1 heavy metal resistance protein CzcN [Antarcticimicrobium luteum]
MRDSLLSLHSASLITAIAAALLLGGLLAWNLYRPGFGFWPAGDEAPVRHHTAFGLFRIFCGATVVFALLEIGTHGWGHWSRYAVGVPLMAVAFGITLWGYRFLGIENTYCASDGLVTSGMYEYSRNPQYVTSVLATVGLGIASGSLITLGLAGVLFLLYFLFVLNEERWLMQGYGDAFRAYMQKTPRFVDARSLMRARAAILESL